MPRNGAGVMSQLAGTMAVDGETIDPDLFNNLIADIIADLNHPRPVSAGGTGATSAAGLRELLELEVGTDVQAFNSKLASLAELTLLADRGLMATGADTLASFTLTAAGRALLDDADAAAQRNTLGLGLAAVRGFATNSDFDLDLNAAASRSAIRDFVLASAAGIGFAPDAEWQDLSAFRSANTSVQNTTNYTVGVSIRPSSVGGGRNIEVSPDNLNWVVVTRSGSEETFVQQVNVPRGHYINFTGGFSLWSELREPI